MSDLGDQIRARRETLGLSQTELAAKASVPPHIISQQTINRIESGVTKWSRAIVPILAVLGMDEKLAGPPPEPATPAIWPEIPIIAVSDMSADVFELTGLPVGAVPRPAALSTVPGVYAIYMRGPSMTPMYRSGDLLIINPHHPPRPEDGALFLSRERDRFRIGEFLRETGTEWVCKRWGNKPAEFRLRKHEFPNCEPIYTARSRP